MFQNVMQTVTGNYELEYTISILKHIDRRILAEFNMLSKNNSEDSFQILEEFLKPFIYLIYIASTI